MTRIIAVTDVLLDRAWPELGPMLGEQRRELGRTALVELVQTAREDADALVFAGNLVDRGTVMPGTLELLAQVLSAFPGTVIIVPGATDWYSEDSPYATTAWPHNVRVITDDTQAVALDGGLQVWGRARRSATTGPLTVPGPGPGGDGGHIAVLHVGRSHGRAEPAEEQGLAAEMDRAGVAHAILGRPATSHPDARTTNSGALLAEAGADEPAAAVRIALDRDGTLIERGWLEVGGAPPELRTVDVSPLATTEALRAALTRQGSMPVQLIGTLRSAVLLPANDPAAAPAELSTLHLEDLAYEPAEPPEDDPTATAEFVRTVRDGMGTAMEQHQATALGLLALGQDGRAMGSEGER
jgi:hypothetical protein